jgi:hypothetical protein
MVGMAAKIVNKTLWGPRNIIIKRGNYEEDSYKEYRTRTWCSVLEGKT